jgi:hypothetical protein
MTHSGEVAITMAGLGSRFRAAGYSVPKYEIEALGRPLFDWSISSLSAFAEAGWRFSFAMLREAGSADYVRRRCNALGVSVSHILELDRLTDGQATTARLLADKMDKAAPLAIYNIDTCVRPGLMAPTFTPADCEGWIPCFPGAGEIWSFVRLNENGEAVEVREKTRISPHATVGLYWFSSASLYCDTYDGFFASGNEEKGERYIAPMYNQLIAAGRRVRITHLPLDAIGTLGTPEQVAAFQASPPPFVRNGAR